MAIAFDNVGSGANIAGNSTWNWSHTCAGSNLILVVGIGIVDTNGTPALVSTITYGAQNFVKIRRDANGNANFSELWYLIAPLTGANTITVQLSAVPAQSAGGGSISLTGVAQSNPIDAQNTANGVGTSASGTVTTVTNNAWIIDVVNDNANDMATATAGGSQLKRYAISESGASRSTFGSTRGAVTPTGATTMTWTGITAGQWGQSLVAVKPVGAGGGGNSSWLTVNLNNSLRGLRH
jgi:hypothetical protein